MKNKQKIKVNAIQCPFCKDIIYSRARHDFRTCSCEKYAIDGGFDYVKLGFPSDSSPPELFDLELEVTKRELFYDWDYGKDKFGLIKKQ